MSLLNSRAGRFLRSRRLAVTLLLGISFYTWVATLVPQGQLLAPEVVSWAREHTLVAPIAARLGLYGAYSNPVFIAVAVLLALSTVTCSWERSRSALVEYRRLGKTKPSEIQRLREHPEYSLALAPSADVGRRLDDFARILESRRFRVIRGPALVEARRNAFGMLGSPLFHWCLAALIVVVGAGRLTRAEGTGPAVLGKPMAETHQSYLIESEGPLFFERHTGVVITVTGLVPQHVVDGVYRGAAATVTLRDVEGGLLKRQLVYPNHPLRWRALMVHVQDFGLAPTAELVDEKGESRGKQLLINDFPADPSPNTKWTTMYLTSIEGVAGRIMVRVPLEKIRGYWAARLPKRKSIEFYLEDAGAGSRRTIGIGESAPVTDGYSLRLEALDYYVKVSVANDWSVTWMYLLFVLTTLAATLSLLHRYGLVKAVVVTKDGTASLHVAVRGDRIGLPTILEQAFDELDREERQRNGRSA